VARASILDHLTALADTTRNRILLLLEGQELTVSELCAVMQLPQSTMSRHLKALGDSGWVSSRAEGTSHLYTMVRPGSRHGVSLDASAAELWALVRSQIGSSPAMTQDLARLQRVLAQRRTRSQEFFSSGAAQWDHVRDELFGREFHMAALAALASPDWVVGDLGCGTGQIAAILAPFVARVVAVDASPEMLHAARQRIGSASNVDLRRGDLEALPLDDQSLDAAVLTLVLHHAPDPSKTLIEVARVLKPGGRALLVDMTPHDREGYRQQMGHVWLGFSDDHIRALLGDAGFVHVRIVPIEPDARAKGPGLFVATGWKPTHTGA
jgi:SAM-dependent methyltransferase